MLGEYKEMILEQGLLQKVGMPGEDASYHEELKVMGEKKNSKMEG